MSSEKSRVLVSKEKKEFSWPIRVYYEDTDSGGVVYYANYLKFMERARTELLRSFGYEQDQLKQELDIVFAVRSVNIEYKKPARFNDELNVVTSITSLGKASIHFKQTIFKQTVDLSSSQQSDTLQNSVESPRLLVEAAIKIACVNATKFTPQSIPAPITKRINQEFHCGS